MRTFTVHERPGAHADRMERAEALVFVEEGFSWTAALLTPFWMLANGLWLALLAYLGVAALLQGIVWATGMSQEPASWLVLALHVLVGFEADAIKRWTLKRNGYAMIASVNGQTVEDCERRFFESWLAGQPFLPMRPPVLPGSREGRLGGVMLALRRS
ncbi:MAG: DUF2628 domain-containing protein [Hyphomicrobiaceae bacterium]|nr:DUF2628 domain-containing protein [Hyphomicrobiaceae bacterium]